MASRIPQIDMAKVFEALGARNPASPRNFSNPKLQVELPLIPTAALGANRESFIFNDGHQTGVSECGLYDWVGGAPSTKTFKTEEWRFNARLQGKPREHVGTNYKRVIPKLLEEYGADNLVVVITLPTHLHAKALIYCMKKGVKFIVTDKPVTVTIEEFAQVQKLARKFGVTILVTFNHVHNAPMALLRFKTMSEIAMKGEASVTGEAGFGQDWVHGLVENWRVEGADPTDPNVRTEGVADIWSHAMHGLFWVTGGLKIVVKKSVLGRQGNHGYLIYDHGHTDVATDGGFKGNVHFTQVDYAGQRKDDYYIRINFEDLGESWMYRMWWSPDGILQAPIGTDTNDRASWTAKGHEFLRGHDIFGPINDRFTNPPAGHLEAWKAMWGVWYKGAAGLYLRQREHNIVPGLPSHFSEEPTTLSDSEIVQQGVHDAIQLHEKEQGGDPFVEEREKLVA